MGNRGKVFLLNCSQQYIQFRYMCVQWKCDTVQHLVESSIPVTWDWQWWLHRKIVHNDPAAQKEERGWKSFYMGLLLAPFFSASLVCIVKLELVKCCRRWSASKDCFSRNLWHSLFFIQHIVEDPTSFRSLVTCATYFFLFQTKFFNVKAPTQFLVWCSIVIMVGPYPC